MGRAEGYGKRCEKKEYGEQKKETDGKGLFYQVARYEKARRVDCNAWRDTEERCSEEEKRRNCLRRVGR